MADWRQIAEAASLERASGRIDNALRLYRSAVPMAEDEGDPVALGSLLHNFGFALFQAGDGVQAREVLLRAQFLHSSSPEGGEFLGETLRLLGMAEVELGDLSDGVEHIERAISHCQARDDVDGATRAQLDLGLALKDSERLTEAAAHLTAALSAARRAGMTKVAAHALTGLGLVEEKLERRDQARAHDLEALALYRQVPDLAGEATVLYNLASLHSNAGELEEAARLFDEALDLDMRLGDKLGAADCRTSLASIQIELGHPADARALLTDALAFYRAGGYRRRASGALVDLAAIARDDERFAAAEAYLGEALTLVTELADPLELHDVLLHWGDLCFMSGDRPGARVQYAAAASAIRQARNLLASEQDAVSFFSADRVESIDRLIALTSEDDLQECVEWIERAKSQEMVRRLAGIYGNPPRGAPADLVASWRDAAEQVRGLSAELAGDEPAVPEVLALYAEAQRRLGDAAEALDEFDPDWAALRLGDALSWDGIQALMARLAAENPSRSVVFVHYYLRETAAVVIGLRPGREPDVTEVAVPLAELRSAGAVPAGQSWAGTERLLAKLVVPITGWAGPGDRVVISAHDTLHRFALHAVSIGGQPLGERNVVSYAPSVAVLRHCMSRRGSRADHAVILADTRPDLPLPFARDQATAVARALAGHGVTATCALGADATFAALASDPQLADAAFVHFAVHGTARPSAGLESGVRLADGLLTARQFLTLRLNADLVFLGACDTGVSEQRAGDELLGLIRSAIYAGTSSVIASLWPVDQLSSAMLIVDFYRRHLAGEPKPDALRAAQRWLRQATARDALEYLSAASDRAAGNPGAETTIMLARAQVLLFAYDLPAAQLAVEHILARPGLTPARIREANQISLTARIGSRAGHAPDYARCPFSSPNHWAPFIIVGGTT